MILAKRAGRSGMAVSLGRNSVSLPVTSASSPPLYTGRRPAKIGQSRAKRLSQRRAFMQRYWLLEAVPKPD